MEGVDVMGGKEGSRGYLYQAFASVLLAVSKENWDKIYIEYPSRDDKIDVALIIKNKVKKVIQVKSTINSFDKNSMKKWLFALIKDDSEASEYELVLIGNMSESANKYKKCIEKYQDGIIDSEVNKTLSNEDITILNSSKVSIVTLPCETKQLEGLIRDGLNEYFSRNNISLSFEQIGIIARATVTDCIIASVSNRPIFKKEFNNTLINHFTLLAKDYSRERTPIAVVSFPRSAISLDDKSMSLSLLDMFDKRKLKDEYSWDDIYNKLHTFLISRTTLEQVYKIYLDAHASIAFATGRILDSKSGINVFPMQKTANNGIELWDISFSYKREHLDWCESNDIIFNGESDVALILSITNDIYSDVVNYIKDNNLPIGHAISFTPPDNGPSRYSIKNGNKAMDLVYSIQDVINRRSTLEKSSTLHIFASAPNSFMFFLGQYSRSFGKCVLYEYDFEQVDSHTYTKAFHFTK